MIAGVWIAPAASATARARTVTLCPSSVTRLHPGGPAVLDQHACPPAVFTTMRAPLS